MSKENKGFTDPIVRCMSCSQLMLVGSIAKTGCCPKCGNKRVTDVRTLTDDELKRLRTERMREKGVTEEFLSEFQEVPDADLI